MSSVYWSLSAEEKAAYFPRKDQARIERLARLIREPKEVEAWVSEVEELAEDYMSPQEAGYLFDMGLAVEGWEDKVLATRAVVALYHSMEGVNVTPIVTRMALESGDPWTVTRAARLVGEQAVPGDVPLVDYCDSLARDGHHAALTALLTVRMRDEPWVKKLFVEVDEPVHPFMVGVAKAGRPVWNAVAYAMDAAEHADKDGPARLGYLLPLALEMTPEPQRQEALMQAVRRCYRQDRLDLIPVLEERGLPVVDILRDMVGRTKAKALRTRYEKLLRAAVEAQKPKDGPEGMDVDLDLI